MRHTDIQIGRVYRLKSTRQQAYGLAGNGEYLIDNITFRAGYKMPFVWAGIYAFKPSDFLCQVYA